MSRQYARDIQREISAGRDGQAQRFAFAGVNNNLPVGKETSLWELGGLRQPITNPNGVQLYASSTDINDNSLMVAIGIDNETDGRLTISFFQLDGQNKVPLSDTMFRVFGHANIGAGQFNGNIYVYEDDTVIGGVPQTFSKIRSYSQNNEQGVNGTYRVPNNATAYFDNFKTLINPKKFFIINFKTKFFGETNFGYVRFPANPQILPWAPRFPVPARTDIEFTATAEDNKSAITFLSEGTLEFE